MSLSIDLIEPKNQKHHPKVGHPEVMMQHEFSTLIVAPKGSGKTNLICNLIMKHYKGYFHRIIVCSPTVDNDSKWSVVKKTKHLLSENKKKSTLLSDQPLPKKNLQKVVHSPGISTPQDAEDSKFDGKLDESDIIMTLAELLVKLADVSEEMEDIRGKLKAQDADEEDSKMYADRVLVIMDDQAGQFQGGVTRNPEVNFVLRHRHYGTSVIIVTQAYKAIPKSIRTNCNSLICFEIPNKKELEAVYEEWPEGMNVDEWLHAYKIATDASYSFLYLNNHFVKGKRAFIRFEKRITLKEFSSSKK